MDYLFIFPTEAEAAPFRRLAPEAEVLISGVGMAATAATVAHLAQRDDVRERGCCVVLAGVAGSYTDSIAVGDVVEVASECCVELPERFRQTYTATCRISTLRSVRSATVHGAGCAPSDAEVENMEGAALYAVASAMNICATELRAISNRVGEEFEKWHFEEATEALASALMSCITGN